MRKFENLYAGIIEKTLVGGLDVDLLDKQITSLPQLDIYADNGVMVGFISTSALGLALGKFEEEGVDRRTHRTLATPAREVRYRYTGR